MNAFTSFGIAAALVGATAFLGSRFTSSSTRSAWYDRVKPSFTPPAAVFPVVWTVLYILMAVVLGRAFKAGDSTLVWAFVINLVLNVAWTYAFFGARSPGAALVVMALLLLSTAWLLARAHRSDSVGFYMLLPYAAWLAFATALNAAAAAR